LDRRAIDFFVAALQREQARCLFHQTWVDTPFGFAQGSELVELQVRPYGQQNRYWF